MQLEISGPKLKLALEALVTRAEEHGGVEAYVEALSIKSALFRDALAGELSLKKFRTLCAHMSTVRRRIGVEIREAHAMRYFFPKELEYMLSKVGFKMIALTRFLSVTEAPREEDWNVAVVARAEEHGAR